MKSMQAKASVLVVDVLLRNTLRASMSYMQSVQVQTTVVDVVLRNMLQASMSYMQVKTSVADVLLRNTLQGSMQSRDAVWPLVSF